MKPNFSRLRKILPILTLGLSALLLSGLADAALKPLPNKACGYVFRHTDEDDFGVLRSDYDFYKNYDAKTSTVLEDVPVLNQRSYGCCWVTSYLGYVNRSSGVVLSDTFLALTSLVERASDAVSRRVLIGEGGHHPYAIYLASAYGSFPEEVWKTFDIKLDIQAGSNGSLFVERINLRLARYFRETEPALKRFNEALAKDPTTDPKSFFTAAEDTLYKKAKDSVTSDINALFSENFGNVPKTFKYQGKTYTPLEFGKKVLPQDMQDLVYVSPKPEPVTKLNTVYTSSTLYPDAPASRESEIFRSIIKKQIELEWTEIDQAIETSLKKKEPVLFRIDIKRAFIDKKSGIMSVDGYATHPEWLEEVQTLNQTYEGFVEGGHAVMITGVYRDKAGKTIGYRVQNSWGSEVGEGGYNIMDLSYIKTFGAGFEFKPEALKN